MGLKEDSLEEIEVRISLQSQNRNHKLGKTLFIILEKGSSISSSFLMLTIILVCKFGCYEK